jgi:general secretion pathway protein D
MTKTFPLNKALEIFNDISKKFLGKVIIDPENHTQPIGFNIDKMHWIDAMELILRTNNLWYQEYEDYIKIIPLSEATGQTTGAQGEKEVNFNTREVTISAVFFEVNESKLRQAGMSWNFFRDKDVNLGATNTSVDARSGLFQVDFSPDWEFADIMAVFKSLESDQIGEIIANPQITVRSGEEGRIQVGSDIAVTVQDFAGNSVTQFFSTGTIIKVTPTVMVKDTVPFTHLDLQVERSSSSGETQGLEIQKTTAETAILLLDGEETVIGGLYTNQKTNSREGVPFLKDLPWWFFGLRWVFGFESKNVVKKELLMLLKADLLPTLRERLARKLQGEKQHLLMEKSKEFRKQFDYYERQYKVGKQR